MDKKELTNFVNEKFMNIKDCLLPYLEAWTNGEEPEFEFYGITSTFIMQKEGIPYEYAIWTMNDLLEEPQFIHMYPTGRPRILDVVDELPKDMIYETPKDD